MKNRIAAVAISAVLGVGLAYGAGAQDAVTPSSDEMGPGEMMFKKLDANGDGKVTRDEVRAGRAASVAGIDKNGDGKITEDEAVAFAVARATEMATARAKERFASQDLNSDGVLTVEELMAPPAPDRMFERADADGDGAVSADEFDAMAKRMHERMGEMRGRMGGEDGQGGWRGPFRHWHKGMMGQDGMQGDDGQ